MKRSETAKKILSIFTVISIYCDNWNQSVMDTIPISGNIQIQDRLKEAFLRNISLNS